MPQTLPPLKYVYIFYYNIGLATAIYFCPGALAAWLCLLDENVVIFLCPAIISRSCCQKYCNKKTCFTVTKQRTGVCNNRPKAYENFSSQEFKWLLICRWYELTQNPARSQSEFTAVFTHRCTIIIVPYGEMKKLYDLTKWPALSWLDSSIGRALHR